MRIQRGEMMTDKKLRHIMEQSEEDGRRALFDEYCGYVYVICANKLKSCGTSEDIDECISDSFGDLRGIVGTIAKRTAYKLFQAAITEKRYHCIY